MKRITDFFVNILLAIVYPNRILNFFRVKNLDQNSNKILGNDNVVKVLALVAAIAYVVASRYTPTVPVHASVTLYSVPLMPLLDEGYTHFGSPIPTHITVILSGDQTELDLFIAGGGRGAVRAYIDLDGLDLNVEHDYVPIRIEGADGFTPIASPSVVSGIRIFENVEREFPIMALTTNNKDVFDELDEPSSRYRYRKELVTEYVTIRGPVELLDQVEEVRAIFNAINVESTVGGPRQYQALVVVNNISGVPISGIEVYPEVVYVEVEIYEDLRTINIDFDENVINIPRAQYEVTEVTADLNELVVWGDFADMEETIELPRINFRDMDDDGQIIFAVQLPPGVYTEVDGVPATSVEVVITVIYEEIPQRESEENEEEDSSMWLGEKEEKRKWM